MSSQHFFVTEHTSPCQHIREYPHGVLRENETLELAVKEYRPRNGPSEDEDAVTIIAGHGNGFPKECYEALWDELLLRSKPFKIRSIWFADIANQGASYAKNADKLGDDPNWFDHSRDLLLMINNFRDRIVSPVVGIAHSMGCSQIVGLSLIHPRLFHSLVLIEPIILERHPPGPNAAFFTSLRRETWPNRAKASAQLSKNPFFKTMDPRALTAYVTHALRDLPDGSGVTLATPKAQEAWTYARMNVNAQPDDLSRHTPEARARERLLQPDLEPYNETAVKVFNRPESAVAVRELPRVRPRALFLYGERTEINLENVRELHKARMGVGPGGSGGVVEGNVKQKVLEGVGHLVPFERPGLVAEEAAGWLTVEMERWKQEKRFWDTIDTKKSSDGRKKLSEHWLKSVKDDPMMDRPKAKNVVKL
ncbi:alpha/beta-hydrolase [Corynespora cassiicola Philippines]|uniref:Alpha/beta-hydrolase n=1 Tax=Corynespora cassiicola Philippines TaxID=1448308 RepID=A0A2T2NTE0_CORCC|nr:alpha/beta-hydrolase [Corynespora cassiicola Philippines]